MFIEKIQHNIKMRRLRKKINYVIGKMKEHKKDADSMAFIQWANLNLPYLMLMDNEVNQYSSKIKSRNGSFFYSSLKSQYRGYRKKCYFDI